MDYVKRLFSERAYSKFDKEHIDAVNMACKTYLRGDDASFDALVGFVFEGSENDCVLSSTSFPYTMRMQEAPNLINVYETILKYFNRCIDKKHISGKTEMGWLINYDYNEATDCAFCVMVMNRLYIDCGPQEHPAVYRTLSFGDIINLDAVDKDLKNFVRRCAGEANGERIYFGIADTGNSHYEHKMSYDSNNYEEIYQSVKKAFFEVLYKYLFFRTEAVSVRSVKIALCEMAYQSARRQCLATYTGTQAMELMPMVDRYLKDVDKVFLRETVKVECGKAYVKIKHLITDRFFALEVATKTEHETIRYILGNNQFEVTKE